MDTFELRLRTFNNWNSRHLQPRDLATGGQYYTGVGDETRCFVCHKRLCNWESGDDPFDEHKFRYPECQLSKIPKDLLNEIVVRQFSAGEIDVIQTDHRVVKQPKDLMCICCNARPRKVLFKICKHFVVCKPCAEKLEKCPDCQQYIITPSS